MTAPTAAGKPMSPEKLERELLARLGLDPSASPEDVAVAHETVTAYLAAAPRQLRSWARTQAAGADEAYALLTDPVALARAVALVGASARPAVLPGGPATPPAHRDTPMPAAAAVPPTAAAVPATTAKPQVDEDGRRIVSDDEIDALLAEVDPNANPDIVGTPQQRAAAHQRLVDAAPVAAPRGGSFSSLLASNAFRNVALVGATVAAIGLVAVFGFGAGGTGASGIGANPSSAPAASTPVLDQAKVGALMQKIQADPKDADSLMSLGDEYYKVGDYATASNWFTKVTEVEPGNVRGFLALGATAFNQGNLAGAEQAWKQALVVDETNVEAHYDLGFLYLNQQPADMAAVQREWSKVVELAPDSEIAGTVKAHLAALASFAPGSPAPSSDAGPAASGAPVASPAPSTAPAASPAPAGSPQP
jgi:cytochrome c-type biogenesis protein CcmH/NrfG